MEKEIWKVVPDFEDYQVSSLGRVKSFKYGKEKIFKMVECNSGYYSVKLSGKTKKMFSVHVLVAIVFLNHTPNKHKIVVNHKNFIRTDNRVENLEIITNRENLNKKHLNSVSGFSGVHKHSKNKWKSSIYFNGKSIFLGVFNTKEKASEYYQNALKSIELNTEIEISKPVLASKYKGVTWSKSNKKWFARIVINSKRKYLGQFDLEIDAHNAYQKELKKLIEN